MPTQTAQQPSKQAIQKAGIDLASTKYQMIFGALLIIFSCCAAFGSTLKIGFLLDDYLHLDYAARALSGDWAPLLNNFTSNWGGSDIMKSYRPIISLSIFTDYLLYHTHAFGYHLTNLLVFCACSVMVALVTLELTGRVSGRSGALTALWAGLLFSVYPLHAESVAWIIGRVDTFATFFYLASLYCFLRLELLKEPVYLWRSLLFFLLSLTSKEIAVSLPAAVALLACLPPGKLQHDVAAGTPAAVIWERIKHAFFASIPYWLTLLAYAIFRQALLGTAVGGYGGAGIADLFRSLHVFADRDSLTKIFVPVSEEYLPVRSMAASSIAPVATIGALFLIRQLSQYARASQKLLPFLLPLATIFWLALALVPAFQIWHIYPNLVGSRLFFLSSCGLCVALALMALPAAEPIGKKGFATFSTAGVVALAALYLVWFNALQVNLRAWKEASVLVEKFEQQIKEIALTKTIAIFNLPQDHKGAGMIGRRLYLDISTRPPFNGVDLSSHLQILEPKITGSREYTWPHQLWEMARLNGKENVYIWSNATGKLESGAYLAPDYSFARPVTQKPAPARELADALYARMGTENGNWTTVGRQGLSVTRQGTGDDAFYTISNSALVSGEGAPGELSVPLKTNISPAQPSTWMVSIDGAGEDEGLTGKCRLAWYDKSDAKKGEANAYFDKHRGQYLFNVGRYRAFMFGGPQSKFKLFLNPQSKGIKIAPASLRETSSANYAPYVHYDKNEKRLLWDVGSVLKDDSANGQKSTYTQLLFFVTAPGTTIDPNTESDLYRPAALQNTSPAATFSVDAANSQGSVELETLLKKDSSAGTRGLRQIVAVLETANGKSRSLTSEPVTIGE